MEETTLIEKPIAFYPQVAKVLDGDIEAAIYYQQLYYWKDKGKREDGWFYKTKVEIEEETTLNRYQQDRCRKKLENLGWIETKTMKAKGAPTIHFKCKTSLKLRISENPTNGKAKTQPMEKRKPNDSYISNTENTTEITPSPAPASPAGADTVLSFFKETGLNTTIDPANKTQRRHAEWLLASFGADEVKHRIESLKELRSFPDIPYKILNICDPKTLRESWNRLEDFSALCKNGGKIVTI